MKDIIVYDFDKTLTYKDTLFDFFSYSSKKNILYPFKLFIYFLSMICAKIGVISNSDMKEFGIRLFLKGMDKRVFWEKCKKFSTKIVTNELYKEIMSKQEECYIVTGSFEDYIKPLFCDNVKVIGSRISFKDNRVYGLEFNAYKEKKIEALKKAGIESIDLFYTDSMSDLKVAKISKKMYIVNGDSLIECSTLDDFYQYFGSYKNKNQKQEKIVKFLTDRGRLLFVRR